MLDTNCIDKLFSDKEFADMLNRSSAKGQVKLFITSVVRGEIQRMPDSAKRGRCQQLLEYLLIEQLPLEYAPYGYAYGECYGGLSPRVTLDCRDFTAGNTKHLQDAMIAATASSRKYSLNYIVTDDKRFIRKMNRQDISTKALSYLAFKAAIAEVEDNSDLSVVKKLNTLLRKIILYGL